MDELDISEEVFLNIFGRLQKHMDTSEEPITDDDPRSGMSGFSKNQLTAAFEKVQNQDDWKAPISAVIDISEGPIVEASIAYFTSTAADFLPIKCGGKAGKYRVKSIGYRAGPAGDH